MFLLSRMLVFFLLYVDWVEDPHMGRYLFSRPLASSDVSPLDPSFRQGKHHDETEKGLNPGLPTTEFQLLAVIPRAIPLEGALAESDRSSDFTYVFLSLQL